MVKRHCISFMLGIGIGSTQPNLVWIASYDLFYSTEVKNYKSSAVDMTCSSRIHMEHNYHDEQDAQDKQDSFRSLQTI